MVSQSTNENGPFSGHRGQNVFLVDSKCTHSTRKTPFELVSKDTRHRNLQIVFASCIEGISQFSIKTTIFLETFNFTCYMSQI